MKKMLVENTNNQSESFCNLMFLLMYRLFFTVTTSGIGVSFIGTVNNISFMNPPFPLLSNLDKVHEDMFCDADNVKDKDCAILVGRKICRCLHRIKFKLNSIAELFLINVEDRLPHPMHLHGHKFHVVDMGMLQENMTVSEVKNYPFPKKFAKSPAYKDTVRRNKRPMNFTENVL
jgi:Multicopper oxidase